MSTKGYIVKKGIERLARIYCWPNDPIIAEKDKYEFDALCEFVMFNEFVKKPFFSILHEALTDQIVNLYLHLLPSVNKDAPMLTFKEAFLFFRLIGKKQTQSILDVISCPPSTYNGILESIENLEYELFILSFENYDNRQMFQVLWQMRYILYGINDAWEHSEPTWQISSSHFNAWTKSCYNYQSFFCDIPEENLDNFIKEKVLDIVNPESSSKKKRRKRQQKHVLSAEDIVEEYIGYLDDASGKSLFYSQWKNLVTEFKDNSNHNTHDLFGCDKMAELILTHNMILHKDDIMKIYGIDSSEIYEEYINGDVYVYDGEKEDLGKYILYYTNEISTIYNMVKDILKENRYLERLVSCISKEHNINININTENTNKNIEDQSLELKMDNTNSEWFEKIPQSKLKGKSQDDINNYLYESLQKLYKIFINQKCISTNTEEGLFIYRLSGLYKNHPYEPEITIETTDKNKSKYGYIFRCLFEDYNRYYDKEGELIKDKIEQKSVPRYKKLCELFNIKTNINGVGGKNNKNKTMLWAINTLEECGFINIDIFKYSVLCRKAYFPETNAPKNPK